MDFSKTNSTWLWNSLDFQSVNQFAAFRQEVVFSPNASAKLYISCDTNYCVWLNGHFVSTGQYLAYPHNKFYDVLELSRHAKPGKNTLAILVYYQGIDTSCYKTGTPGLIYAIRHADSWISNQAAMTGEGSGYQCGEQQLITLQLGPTLAYDAEKETAWKTESLDSTWKPAVKLDFCDFLPKIIEKRPIQKLDLSMHSPSHLIAAGQFIDQLDETHPAAERMQAAYFSSKSIFFNSFETISEDNTYLIYDLERETSGYLELDFDLDENGRADLEIGYGEHLESLRVRSYIDGRCFSLSYRAKPGKNQFTHYFRRIAGRYLQVCIRNLTGTLKINRVGLQIAHYPVKCKPMPPLTDSLDRKIYETSIATLVECMHEHYEDCPWREQSLYAMDSRSQALFGYAAFGNYEFAKASIRLLGSSLRGDGFLDLCAPSGIDITIPSFSMMWIVFAVEYVRHSQDFRYAHEAQKTTKIMLDRYFSSMEDHLLPTPADKKYWNFYDWENGLIGADTYHRFDVLLQLFLAYALQHAIELAGITGSKDLKKEWTSRKNELKLAVNKTFYDEKKGLYHTFLDQEQPCELAQALAILTGFAPSPAKLSQILAQKNDLVPTTLSSCLFKYMALLKYKRNYPAVLREIRFLWGKMLYQGATAFYETIGGAADFEEAGSLCHGWSAVPIYVYHKIFGNFYKN